MHVLYARNKMKKLLRTFSAATALAAAMACGACGNGQNAAAATPDTTVQAAAADDGFNADSAYAVLAAQVAFGPRVPGSDAHARCRDWLVAKLAQAGADTVFVQHGTATGAGGKTVPVSNIIARFGTDKPRRLMLLAHYDTRPWADNDPDPANRDKPIDGANDGASGVAVILETARLLGQKPAAAGIDILLTDAEDSGISGDNDPGSDRTWCLGTQYFVAHMPIPRPSGAILLDMVGGRDAVFRHEYFGVQAAPQLAALVLASAKATGNAARFEDALGGAVNDDHVPLIGAGIPAIDIIECGNPQTGSFNPTWHTLQDNLSNIDRTTLHAVGRTLVHAVHAY